MCVLKTILNCFSFFSRSFKVEFTSSKIVTGIATKGQRILNADKFVQSYTLQYRVENTWIDYKVISNCHFAWLGKLGYRRTKVKHFGIWCRNSEWRKYSSGTLIPHPLWRTFFQLHYLWKHCVFIPSLGTTKQLWELPCTQTVCYYLLIIQWLFWVLKSLVSYLM